ncbi:unnamed protein product [Protopolystoma xenopodis]|uniref:Uncharacterized protein n=1 Tax=Protopolystoma xenopodis TaxID=117903 RepID=A0A448X6V0_9PLAT|nr:unnamed protein product [Protopolystoma xenopodis]
MTETVHTIRILLIASQNPFEMSLVQRIQSSIGKRVGIGINQANVGQTTNGSAKKIGSERDRLTWTVNLRRAAQTGHSETVCLS